MKIEITKLIVNEEIKTGAIVSCVCNITDGQYTVSKNLELNPVDIDNFIPIESVDEEIVKGWILEKLGQDGISGIQNELEEKRKAKNLKQVIPSWAMKQKEEYEAAQKEGRITRY